MSEIKKEIKSIEGIDVRGKRVFLRTSVNVPIDADRTVGDEFRLKQGLKTLEYLAAQGAKIVVVGYIGRDGATLKPVSEAFARLAPNIKITFSDAPLAEVGAEIALLKEGECLMLENIRREAGEEKNDPALVEELAGLADIFVSDAFAEAHRTYASNVGVAAKLPAYAGFLLTEEIANLTQALTPPKNSLAIIGGAKFETKEPLIEKLAALYTQLLLGGALQNDLAKSRGLPVGASLISATPVPAVIAGDARITTPVDLIVMSDTSPRTANTADIRSNESIVDIGPETSKLWAGEISRAEFVLWNGPMGIYEKGHVAGTDALAHALIGSSCRAVIGGGDTAAAVAQFAFDSKRIFLSTGGGAMLQFLADGTLPGIEALKK